MASYDDYNGITEYGHVVIVEIALQFLELEKFLKERTAQSRQLSLALTKLEEAYMWAADALQSQHEIPEE